MNKDLEQNDLEPIDPPEKAYTYSGLVFSSQVPWKVLLCGRVGPGDMGLVYTGHRVGPGESLDTWGRICRAMSQQVLRDAGLRIPTEAWSLVTALSLAPLKAPGMVFYLYAQTERLSKARSKNPTKCMVSIEDPKSLPINTASTLQWVIPFLLDPLVVKPPRLSSDAVVL